MSFEFQVPPLNDELLNEDGLVSKEWEQWLVDLQVIQTEIVTYDVIVDLPSLAANSSLQTSVNITQVLDKDGNTVTVPPGAIVVDLGYNILHFEAQSITANIIHNGTIIASTNRLTLFLNNISGGAINPASATYKLVVLKG